MSGQGEQRSFFMVMIGGLLLIAMMGGGAYVTYTYIQKRGIRNNNPGNLKITKDAWKGKVPVTRNTDGTFEQFEEYSGLPGHIWGLRAMYIDLRGDVLKDGLNTITKLITSYAPASDKNDTPAYIASVSSALGKGSTAALTAADLPALMKAITKHENGVQPYPDADINKAISLA